MNAKVKVARKKEKKLAIPRHLSAKTRHFWQSVVTEFELEEHHLKLLTLACEALDRREEARKILEKEGLTYLDRFLQPRSRPEVNIERDARLGFARLLREIGLDSEPEDSRPPKLRY